MIAPPPAPPPTVSVVVPTFNRQASLDRTLVALAAQVDVRGEVEVIVVNDGSTDGTGDYLSSDTLPLPVVVLEQGNAGPAAARNRGLEASTHELIVFVDDDTRPAPDLVSVHQRRHTGHDDLVVIGPMLTPDDVELQPWLQWEQDQLAKQYRAMDRGDYEATARQFYTGNASVRKSHLMAVGGFDPTFRRAEDVELAYRLADRGLRFVYEPAAVVHHYPARTYEAWRRVASDYGRNDVRFGRDQGRDWLLDSISREFHGRHRLVQALTRATLTRPRLAEGSAAALSGLARMACRLRIDRVDRPLLSAVYNQAYYLGMAEELGDPEALLARFAAAADAA